MKNPSFSASPRMHRCGASRRRRSWGNAQRGGTTMGIVLGLLVGLGVALAVALYVAKVPVPFVNKVPQRTAEQEAAEVQRNRNWDPNARLGNNGSKAPGATSGAPTAASPPPTTAATATIPPYVPPVPPAVNTPGRPGTAPAPTVANARAPVTVPGITPSTAPANATREVVETPKSTKPGADPFTYFVQAGAYARQEDADQQRARLAILGYTAKVTEREQVGRTMYRVRLGPFENKDTANTTQGKLQQSGIEAALVAVEKSR